ncbi:PREDICTED: uncharacterized protein LOC105461159, partial [Wasmannia auropunctata]|uniref:uncharacterized protein LOC105461159 n=1 Tax=Wasmannia auropunctata TaxID=64793 RepID=UPI0005EDAD1D
RLQRFRCHNGQCITGKLLCNGRADCKDLSDETVAECKEILCPNYAFRCNYGGCINGDYVCNGIQDCIDNSDETQLQCTRNITNVHTKRSIRKCEANQFKCDNGQCIYSINVCDGTRNCVDGSDEDSRLCRRIIWPGGLQPELQSMYKPRLPRAALNDFLHNLPFPEIHLNYKCEPPPRPPNGRRNLHPSQCSGEKECIVPDGKPLAYGTRLIYSCNLGYKIIGQNDFRCLQGGWNIKVPLTFPKCIAIGCKVLTTVSIQARCTYNDQWISCKTSVPGTKAILDCQNGYRPENNLLFVQGNTVTCNMNGEWEPELIRCVSACGTLPPDVKATIVGGVRPNITEFPWHASLYRDEPGKTKKYFCGATIIQKKLLITAAHCVFDENTGQLNDASKIYVLVGNLFRDYDYLYHNRILVKYNQVKHIYIIRNYLGLVGNYLWDIAILELVRPFVLSTWLVPVCINTVSDKSAVEVGSYGKVAGFGRTAHGETSAMLQALIVPVISFSQCISASQNANTRQFITNDKFCAGYRNGSSVCDGDSGGGLVFKTNNTWYLRGIVSVSLGTIQDGGIAHCDNNLYTLYTDVSRHISWIQEVISNVEQDQRHALCSNESYTRCS